MISYVTFDDLRSYLRQDSSTGDEVLVKQFAERASRQFERWCRGRKFYPRQETRYYDHPPDDSVLKLDDDLLAVTTFTTNNGSTTVSSGDYYLLCGNQYGLTPYDRIVLRADGDQPNLLYSGTPQRANAVAGVWGYHEEWADAWQDSNDSIQDAGGINASATTITVGDVDGAGIYGLTPRLKKLQLLKIDSEYLYVTDYDTSANTLTVRRGMLGTTAASHDKDATIYVYRPMPDIEQAVLDLAKYLYLHKDQSDGDVMAFPEMGAVQIPKGVPVTVKWAVEAYRRRRLG